jgi:hypothetical protein
MVRQRHRIDHLQQRAASTRRLRSQHDGGTDENTALQAGDDDRGD